MIRPALPEDLKAATGVFLTTLDDLRQRHNAGGTRMHFDDWMRGYEHVLRTGIFNVVEEKAELDCIEVDCKATEAGEKKSEIVGVCNGVIRDKRFFLTGFWLLPGHQNAGTGSKLIEKTWADARAKGAEHFFVWASIDWPALATYMKLGMLPGYQIFTIALERDTYRSKSKSKSESESKSKTRQACHKDGYRLSALNIETAGEIDAQVRETRRSEDHRFWLETMQSLGFAVELQGRCIGYFYCRKGIIGPLAYLDTAHGEAVLNLALGQVFQDEEKALIYVPGANRLILSKILALGGKMLSLSHFLSTEAFGKPAQYLPSGPLLY